MKIKYGNKMAQCIGVPGTVGLVGATDASTRSCNDQRFSLLRSSAVIIISSIMFKLLNMIHGKNTDAT